MNTFWIYIIITGCIVVIAIIIYAVIRAKIKNKRTQNTAYEEALISLIDGDEENALKKFQEAVFNDSNKVDAYIRLAELLRRRGEPKKALQIHKYLTARKGLPSRILNRISFQIAKDYIKLGANQKAIEILKKLIKQEPQNENYYNLLITALENSSRWKDARETFRRMAKRFNRQAKQITNYDIFTAYKAQQKGEKDWSEAILTQLLKTEPDNTYALIYLGDIFYQDGRIKDAINLYKKAANINVDSAHITFPRLTKAYFESGEFAKMEEIYKEVLEKYPDDAKTIINLAEYYLKMGRLNEAHELLVGGTESHPESFKMNLLLLQTEMELEGCKPHTILQRIIDNLRKKEQFRCEKCNTVINEFVIRCPNCGNWESIKLIEGI